MAEDKVDCSVDDVRDKYTACGTIVNEVLAAVLEKMQPKARILDICTEADEMLHNKLNAIYQKKKTADGEPLPRGVAYPCCISLNECVRNYCPLEDDAVELQEGDVASVELGGHIDGFVATAAHTIVVGKVETTGKKADAIMAAWTAAEAVARAIKPGVSNGDAAAIINKAVADFDCNLVQSTVSFELKQHVIDGAKCILPRPAIDEKQPPCTFDAFEVYAVNIFVSTGEGKPRESGDRPTVYRREITVNTMPKSQAGRALLEEINRKYPCLPFAAIAVGEPKTRRMALTEAQRTGCLAALPPLYEKPGDHVAHFGYTLMLTKQVRKVAGLPNLTNQETIKSERSVKDASVKEALTKKVK